MKIVHHLFTMCATWLGLLVSTPVFADFPAWDFEDGLSGWSNRNASVTMTNDARSGTNALLVTMLNNGVYDGAQVDITAYIPDLTAAFSNQTLLEFSAWVRVPDNSASNVVPTMALRDAVGNRFTFIEQMNTTTGQGIQREDGWVRMRTTVPALRYVWDEYSHDMQSGGALYTPQALALIVRAQYTGSSILVDDVAITPMLPGLYSDYAPPTNSVPDDFLRPGEGADGCRLIDRFGDDVILHGINIWLYSDGTSEPASILWNYYLYAMNERDLPLFATDYGMNVLRLNLDYRWFERSHDNASGVTTFKPEGFAWLDRTLQQARAHGLYLILDLHAPPGGYQGPDGATAAYFSDTNLQKRVENFWVTIAERYRHEPAIAAYDLINEPRPRRNVDWYNEAERLTLAIRTRGGDSNHLVLVEAPFPTDGNGWEILRINDPAGRVLYDQHYYSPYAFTFNSPASSVYVSTNVNLSDGIFGELSFVAHDDWDDTIVSDFVAPVYDMTDAQAVGLYTSALSSHARSTQLFTRSGTNAAPVNIGEYGVSTATWVRAESMAATYLNDLAQVMDHYAVGRQYWNLRGNFGLYPTFTGFLSVDRLRNEPLHAFFLSQHPARTTVRRADDTDADGIADVWERAHFDNLTTAGPDTDTDLDGASDRTEYVAGTDPNEALSATRITSLNVPQENAPTLTWTTERHRVYDVQRGTNLLDGFLSCTTNLIARTSVTVTVESAESATYYRIEVQKPAAF